MRLCRRQVNTRQKPAFLGVFKVYFATMRAVKLRQPGSIGWEKGVAAVDTVVLKFRREGAEVELIGLNKASETIVDRLGIHDKPGALDQLAVH